MLRLKGRVRHEEAESKTAPRGSYVLSGMKSRFSCLLYLPTLCCWGAGAAGGNRYYVLYCIVVWSSSLVNDGADMIQLSRAIL